MIEKLTDKNFLDPEISLQGNCHTCQELISLAAEHCPYCGIKIKHDEMIISTVNTALLTSAISSANSIRTFDVGVFIFLAASIYRVLFDFMSFPLSLWFEIATSVVWILPLYLIGKWFRRHGQWDSRDEEYLSSHKEMKKSFRLWLAVHFLNVILIWIGQNAESAK